MSALSGCIAEVHVLARRYGHIDLLPNGSGGASTIVRTRLLPVCHITTSIDGSQFVEPAGRVHSARRIFRFPSSICRSAKADADFG